MNKWQNYNARRLLSRFHHGQRKCVNARRESFNIDIKWNYIVIMSLFPDKEATRVKNARHRNKSSTGRKCAKTSFRNYRLWIYSRGAFSRAKQFFRCDSQRAQTRTSDINVVTSSRPTYLQLRTRDILADPPADPPLLSGKFAFRASNSNALFVINGFSHFRIASVLGNRAILTRNETRG